MARKAQAAIDFLMTYGWALIALLVVFGVLYTFVELNPKNRIPDTCSFGDSFYCKDFQITKAGILTLSMKNTVGTAIHVNSTLCIVNGQELSYDTPVNPPSAGDFQISCDLNRTLIDKTKVSVTILFYKQGMSFPSTSDGLVVGTPK